MQDKASARCLQRLNALLERVRRTVQGRKQANCLASYRTDFEVTQPALLLGGKMQPHQLESLRWMVNLASQSSNAILADDMGLGKTIQAIAYLAYLQEEYGVTGKHLVICPKTVCRNWMREVAKWFPSANVQFLDANLPDRETVLKTIVRPRKFDILVTTFDGARISEKVLRRIKWEVMVVDEAHKIKNCNTRNFISIAKLQASFKLLLTGTPLSNNLTELWALLNFIMPDLFNDSSLFDDIQNSANQLEGTEEEKLAYQCKVAATFHQIIQPFFKRRTKKTLELGLPPKIEKTLYVPLSPLQLQCYRNFLKWGNVDGELCNIHEFNPMVPRKICLHPYLFECILQREAQEQAHYGWSAEQLGVRMIEASGKLKILDKLLHKLIGENHRVLIFSQFKIMLNLLETYCLFRSYKYCRIDGDVGLDDREQQIDRFNRSSECPVFLLSTKAGGLGINLVAADTVIIYDIDWNPQNDIQAMDRAYRMGQTRTVHVYKLITEHTVEERMLEFQKYKLIWDELVIQKCGFVGKNKRKDDLFSNVNINQLSMLGRGDIFKLDADESDQNIDVILEIGEQKDREQDRIIREKLMQNIGTKNFNPFEEEVKEDCGDIEIYRPETVIRRNYDQDKRERAKFDRLFVHPAYKFYAQRQKIKELSFELFMEMKRDDKCDKLVGKLQAELDLVKSRERFQLWGESQYEMFLEAHGEYLKDDYEGIAAFIGTKDAGEVREYSINFFQQAPNNQYFTVALKVLEVKQARLRRERDARLKEQNKTRKEDVRVKINEEEESEKITAAERRKEEAMRRKEQSERKREEDRKKKMEEARLKKEEELRLREETKMMKLQQKNRQLQERRMMQQFRQKAKQKAVLQKLAKKEKREAEQRAKKERKEENRLRKKQRQQEEIENRERRRETLEKIREEFERKKEELLLRKQAINTTCKRPDDAQTSCTDDKDSREKLQIVTPNKDSRAAM